MRHTSACFHGCTVPLSQLVRFVLSDTFPQLVTSFVSLVDIRSHGEVKRRYVGINFIQYQRKINRAMYKVSYISGESPLQIFHKPLYFSIIVLHNIR